MANDDLISRQVAIDALDAICDRECEYPKKKRAVMCGACHLGSAFDAIDELPSAQPEIIRCKDCKHWRQQTNYQGAPLSFGFCESDDMWQSLYGETYEVAHIDTDDDFYCGYAKRRSDE